MNNIKATEHRLGIARQALKRIAKYNGDQWDDDASVMVSLQMFAEDALRDMDREVNKKSRQRAEERDRCVARLAQEVKETVDP
jgi:hypothetical protein